MAAAAGPEAALAVVVLAAGLGTRMRSELPKVLHRVAGRPMVEQVVRAAAALDPARIVVVVGYRAEAVAAALTGYEVVFAEQREQLGTGHALMSAAPALADHPGPVLVLNGDGPTITPETLRAALACQGGRADGGGDAGGDGESDGGGDGMTLLTVEVDDPTGLGRVVRDADGGVRAIVEHRDASPEERAIREVNPGIYLFDARVWELAHELSADNAQGEYYITDLPRLYLQAGLPVRALKVSDPSEVLAANDRAQLADLERVLRERLRRRWLTAGVTMEAPDTTFIDDEVELEPDVVLEPGVILRGRTRVGVGATVGAYAVLRDCRVAAGAVVAPHTVAEDESLG